MPESLGGFNPLNVMVNEIAYPLSPASRMAVGMDILKAGFVSWVQHQLRAEGIDPLACLPPSSPILKQGFDMDVRAGLIIAREQMDVLAGSDELPTLRRAIRTLLQLRDRWAHQQPLTQEDASIWLKTASEFCAVLERMPASRSLNALAEVPGDELVAATLILTPLLEDIPPDERLPLLTFESFTEEIDRALYGASDQTAFRALTWYSAQQYLLGETPIAAMIVLGPGETPVRDEEGLVAPGFWWLFGLPHDAPLENRIEAHRNALSELEAERVAAYPHPDDI